MKRITFRKAAHFLLIPVLFSLILFSCKKDNFNLDKLTSSEWNPSLAVPIVNTSLDVYNILAREDSTELIVIDPQTRLLALVYKGEVFSFDASEIVNLPDGGMNQDISLTAAQAISFQNSGQFSAQYNYVYNYQPAQGIKITTAQLNSGILDFTINSNFKHNGSIVIHMPTLTKNGVPFQATIPHDYNGANVQISKSIDLSGYTIDMTNGGSKFNEIPVKYTVSFASSGNPVSPTDKISITQSYKNLNYSLVYGDFGQQTISRDKDSILVKIFTNALKGTFKLVNPRLILTTTNTFGFPIKVRFDSLYTYAINTRQTLPIAFSSFPNPFAINYPGLPGNFATTDLVIDKTNSSIIDIITPTPKYLIYKINAKSNPDGPPSSLNFITDKSSFKISTELEMPLEGYAYGFDFLDTATYQFGGNKEEVESILLRLNFENGFPFNMKAQLYLADANLNILDSLLSDPQSFISSGIANAEGRVEQPVTKITDISIDGAKLSHFFDTKYIIIKSGVETYEGRQEKTSRIYDYYKLDVRMGMQVKAKIKL